MVKNKELKDQEKEKEIENEKNEKEEKNNMTAKKSRSEKAVLCFVGKIVDVKKWF